MTVSELTADVLRHLASRVEASHSIEQILYRETELDEIWRLADLARLDMRSRPKLQRRSDGEILAAIANLIHEAHDLIGHTEDTIRAAAVLREAAAITESFERKST